MEENKDFPNIWHAILLLLFLLGLQLIIVCILYDLGINLSPGDPKYGGIVTIFSCGIIFSIVMSYKKISYKQLFNPSSYLTKSSLIIILISTAMISGGGALLISNLDTFIISHFSISQDDIAMFERLLGGGPISIITICILAPIIEEMLFRGILLRSFMCNYSTFNAILFSSLLFAVIHFNIYQIIGAYIGGTFLGWLYVVTQSLWPSIFAHALFNAISMIYYYYYGSFEKSLESATYSSPLTLAIAMIFVISGIKIIQTVSKATEYK